MIEIPYSDVIKDISIMTRAGQLGGIWESEPEFGFLRGSWYYFFFAGHSCVLCILLGFAPQALSPQ